MTLVNVIDTGSYVGNGTSQSISIGWQPAFVFTASSKSGGNPNQRGGCFKSASMAGSSSIRSRQGTAFAADTVTLGADGFDVGADDSCNRNGETYYWYAIRESPTCDVDSFTGADPTDTVFTLNRQPLWLYHYAVTTPHVAIKFPQQATDLFWVFSSSAGTANGLTINADGFTASGGTANPNGETVAYDAFYNLVGANRHWEQGTYTGDGNATQSITLGLQPRVLIIFNTASNQMVWKTDSMPAAGASFIDASTDYGTTLVTLDATGFTTEAAALNTSGVTFYYLAGYM